MAKTDKKIKVINIDGILSIERAVEIKELLLKEIKKDSTILLNLSGAVSIELPVIQLFIAAEKYAKKINANIDFTGNLNIDVQEAFYIAGFIKNSITEASQLKQELIRNKIFRT